MFLQKSSNQIGSLSIIKVDSDTESDIIIGADSHIIFKLLHHILLTSEPKD